MTVLVAYDNAPPAKRKSIYALFIFVFPQKFKRNYAVLQLYPDHTPTTNYKVLHINKPRNIAINIFQFKQQKTKTLFSVHSNRELIDFVKYIKGVINSSRHAICLNSILLEFNRIRPTIYMSFYFIRALFHMELLVQEDDSI